MIVKMITSPNYERMVECDAIHKYTSEDELRLVLYKDDKVVDEAVFCGGVSVYVMEGGKTIDRIHFKLHVDVEVPSTTPLTQ